MVLNDPETSKRKPAERPPASLIRVGGATSTADRRGARMATLTAITMIAFAANSVIARMALGFAEADPTGFTAVRLITGAATLWLIRCGSS